MIAKNLFLFCNLAFIFRRVIRYNISRDNSFIIVVSFVYTDLVLPKEGPSLTGLKRRYRPGMRLKVDCVSYNSIPAANLSFFINSERVSNLINTLIMSCASVLITLLFSFYLLNLFNFYNGNILRFF